MVHAVLGNVYKGRTIGGAEGDDSVIMRPRCGVAARWQDLTVAVERVTCPRCLDILKREGGPEMMKCNCRADLEWLRRPLRDKELQAQRSAGVAAMVRTVDGVEHLTACARIGGRETDTKGASPEEIARGPLVFREATDREDGGSCMTCTRADLARVWIIQSRGRGALIQFRICAACLRVVNYFTKG